MIPALLCVALVASGEAGDWQRRHALEFAEHLFAKADYYRAIGEYERYLYLLGEAATPEALRARWRIASAYLLGAQHEDAAREFGALQRDPEPAIARQAAIAHAHARLLAGDAFATVVTLEPLAEPEPEALVLLGWAQLRSNQPEAAAATLTRVPADTPLRAPSAALAGALRGLEPLPEKSPALAGALSLVPGLGHLYLGQPGIALFALLWNGLFTYGMLDSFLRTRAWGAGTVLAVMESVWYSGTIFGAVSGAHRYNRDLERNRADALAAEHPLPLGVERYQEPPTWIPAPPPTPPPQQP